MKKMYFTITGCTYRYGLAFFKPGMDVTLIKEPENKFDREAIRVEVDGLGTVGYVANSPKTVRGTSMSAGRLYDKIGKKTNATVIYVLPDSVICSVDGEANRSSTVGDTVMESMPAEEETFLFSETTDLDLYSQEDTGYLVPGEAENDEVPADVLKAAASNADGHSKEPETASEDDAVSRFETEESEEPGLEAEEPGEPAQEQAASAADTDTVTQEQDEYDGGKTVSPEEIASALTAALAGLAAEGTAPASEDPDAEYVYGNRNLSSSPEEIGSILSEELAGITPENMESILNGSSGLSAADFVNVLTGTKGSATPETDNTPAEPEPDIPPETLPDAPEPELPEQEERVSSAPGLNFNTVRFPEEEEGYVAPARDTMNAYGETASENQDNPEEAGPQAADDREYREEQASGSSMDEDPTAAPDAVAESEAAEILTVDVSVDPPVEDTPDAAEAGSTATAGDTEEEEADGITKPLVYDESELDENLSQLHLGDIDATYLSDSFLANLKKTLKEST